MPPEEKLIPSLPELPRLDPSLYTYVFRRQPPTVTFPPPLPEPRYGLREAIESALATYFTAERARREREREALETALQIRGLEEARRRPIIESLMRQAEVRGMRPEIVEAIKRVTGYELSPYEIPVTPTQAEQWREYLKEKHKLELEEIEARQKAELEKIKAREESAIAQIREKGRIMAEAIEKRGIEKAKEKGLEDTFMKELKDLSKVLSDFMTPSSLKAEAINKFIKKWNLDLENFTSEDIYNIFATPAETFFDRLLYFFGIKRKETPTLPKKIPTPSKKTPSPSPEDRDPLGIR